MIGIHNADCFDIFELIQDQSIDLILTDPPYGTTDCFWDDVLPLDPLWLELERILKPNSPTLLFGQEPYSSKLRLSNLRNFKYDWYWRKERMTNIMQVKKRPGKIIETISVFYKGQCKYYPQKTKHLGPLRSNKVGAATFGKLVDGGKLKPRDYKDDGTRYPLQVLDFKRPNLRDLVHPTEKPVELMEYLIKSYTEEGDMVLDFTMGSGTTGVACKNLNRSFIGIEKDKKYYKVASKRIFAK